MQMGCIHAQVKGQNNLKIQRHKKNRKRAMLQT